MEKGKTLPLQPRRGRLRRCNFMFPFPPTECKWIKKLFLFATSWFGPKMWKAFLPLSNSLKMVRMAEPGLTETDHLWKRAESTFAVVEWEVRLIFPAACTQRLPGLFPAPPCASRPQVPRLRFPSCREPGCVLERLPAQQTGADLARNLGTNSTSVVVNRWDLDSCQPPSSPILTHTWAPTNIYFTPHFLSFSDVSSSVCVCGWQLFGWLLWNECMLVYDARESLWEVQTCLRQGSCPWGAYQRRKKKKSLRHIKF